MPKTEETPQNELEHKISEAELKAQEPDITEATETDLSFESVSEDLTEESPPEKKGLSRARKIWRRILIWLVVIAVAFAGGFFLDTMMRLQPEKEKLLALQEDLDDTQAEIEALELEIVRLGAFEDENRVLSAEIDQLDLHLVILSLRVSVANASLALEQNRQAEAKLALDSVGSTLDTLKDLLNEEQGEIVDSMIQRYQLVLIELENDGATVLTDLELISNKLMTLENTLFALP